MNKAYYTITEICELLDIKPHTIRYWGTEFPKLKKETKKGATRKYSANELELLKKIKDLIYVKKFTLAGAKTELKKRKKDVLDNNEKLEIDFKKELCEIRDILLGKRK